MSDKEQIPASPVLVGTFELSIQLTQARTMKVNGYLFNTDTSEEINARVDQMQEALERQAIRCDLVNKRAQRAAIAEGVEMQNEHFKAIAEKKKAGHKLATQERTMLDQADLQRRNAQMNIASLDAAIRAGEAKLKLNGASPPT